MKASVAAVEVLVRDVASASGLLIGVPLGSQQDAEELLLERLTALLDAMGYGIHRARDEGEPLRGDQPAFRVDSSASSVLRDVRRAAGYARARSRKLDTGLCTAEPLEDDPMGILMDLLDLEAPMSELAGVVDVIRSERHAFRLPATERSK